ncbi:MAG: hypothetical protein JW786_12140 [Desulfobacterales bacterium]|nr:hypothetical protein [Desulfobacterales bacterium]
MDNKHDILHLLVNPYFELYRQDLTFPLYLEPDITLPGKILKWKPKVDLEQG